MPRTTAASVNAALRRAGMEERIKQGRGYVYVFDGDSCGWYTSSIPVCRVGELPVEWWVAEVKRMKAQHGA